MNINNLPVNRRVIRGNNTNLNKRVFGEKKYENSDQINNISIRSSFVDVKILVSDSAKDIEIYFHGQVKMNGDISFSVRTKKDELKVILVGSGIFVSGDLQLDITIPPKMFKSIYIKSNSADITLDEKVLVEQLQMETLSGDLITNATFKTVNISATSGDVKLFTRAKEDISVVISTTSGDVLAQFINIKNLNLLTKTTTGDIMNCRKIATGSYNADLVDISTTSGDITIS